MRWPANQGNMSSCLIDLKLYFESLGQCPQANLRQQNLGKWSQIRRRPLQGSSIWVKSWMSWMKRNKALQTLGQGPECPGPKTERNVKFCCSPNPLSVAGAEWKGKKSERWVCHGRQGPVQVWSCGPWEGIWILFLIKWNHGRGLTGRRTWPSLCCKKTIVATVGRPEGEGSWNRNGETFQEASTVWSNLQYQTGKNPHATIWGTGHGTRKEGHQQEQLLNRNLTLASHTPLYS